MIDLILLRIMKRRKDYQQLSGFLPRETLDPKTVAILDDFGKYFERYPSHDAIDLATFIPRFQSWHPQINKEAMNGYLKVLANTEPDADDDQRRNVMNDLAEIELMTTFANLASKHADGDLPDTFRAVTAATDMYRMRLGVKRQTYIDTPIEELLKDEFNNAGLHWRLSCLNDSMRRLRPGDFGIIAGRPDKGKTTFIASEVTHFAGQLPPDRNILWLNNEGPGRRIIPRLYQAALNLSMNEMKEQSTAGTLVPAYRAAMGGRLDKVRIFDIHGYSNGQVEMLIEDNNPAIIVYDMIDNIRGFVSESRNDLQLEEMYKWARERSVKYDCIGLATSQISNDGDGLQFPTLGMLKDSKTGKQGACDFQLMIGASNDIAFASSRFISLPKNKLRRPDGVSDPRAEVIFDGLRSRYTDLPIGI